jgi:hypothetical protein
MFFKYSYATCFDHNFGHRQALNEHISSNQTYWIQYGPVFVNRFLRNEYIVGIYLQSYYMIKKVQKMDTVLNNIQGVHKVSLQFQKFVTKARLLSMGLC